MRLVFKTFIFFILGYLGAAIAAIPFGLFFPLLSTFVYPLTWIVFTLYPAYEHFFIREQRTDQSGEQDRIKAYIRYIKIRKFINYIRFISSFFAALLIVIILSIVGYNLNLQADPDFETGKLMLGIFIISWLALYQVIQFGLHKNLALAQEGKPLISIDEYNKIEYHIIKLNQHRRIAILGLILLAILMVYTISIFNEAVIAIVAFIGFLIVMHLLNLKFKKHFKEKIFLHINELKDLNFADYYNKLHMRYNHPIISKNLEDMHTDSYLQYNNDEGEPQFVLWERMDGLRTFLVISVTLDKPVENEVYLSTDNISRKTGQPEIPNATHQFGNIFRLFSNDNVLAYKFMTPVVQENFLKLIANANALDFNCSVQRNEMVIVMKCGSDLFEIGSLFKKLTLENVNQIIAEIRLAKTLPALFSF